MGSSAALRRPVTRTSATRMASVKTVSPIVPVSSVPGIGMTNGHGQIVFLAGAPILVPVGAVFRKVGAPVPSHAEAAPLRSR